MSDGEHESMKIEIYRRQQSMQSKWAQNKMRAGRMDTSDQCDDAGSYISMSSIAPAHRIIDK